MLGRIGCRTRVNTTKPEIMLADVDLLLMERVALGDTFAFEELIERHQHRVVGTVAKMLGDDRDADDVAQQVFLRVWKSAPRYRPSAKFTTWLFTITRNLVFNELRRRNRHAGVSCDEDLAAHDLLDPGPTPSAILLEAELQKSIAEAITDLPEQQRLALVLRRYEDLSYEEIGDVLNLSVSAVKSLLFRARTQLREQLAKYLAS
jgi:RNA polymerase sigma-70 factor (ECF subfamily)